MQLNAEDFGCRVHLLAEFVLLLEPGHQTRRPLHWLLRKVQDLFGRHTLKTDVSHRRRPHRLNYCQKPHRHVSSCNLADSVNDELGPSDVRVICFRF